MRKITIILFYILIAGIFFLKPSVTKAQQCAEWICNWDTYQCTPEGCTVECGCADAGYYTCPPGYYACNRPSGCCPVVGSGGGCECGVNAQGQCRSCNQPSCDWEYRVNCPDGAQRSPPQNLYIKAGGKPTMTM